MQTTYYIHPDRINRLEQQLKRLAKKATKYGITPPGLRIVGPHYEKNNKGEYLKSIEVELTTDDTPIGIDGWELACKFEFTVTGDVLVQKLPSYEGSIPERFFDTKAVCDHCGFRRERKATFLFVKGGEYKRVGSTCMMDYIGIDPNFLAKLAEFEKMVGNARGGEIRHDVVSTAQVIEIATAAVNKWGYVRKGADFGVATGARVMDHLFPTPEYKRNPELSVTKEVVEQAKEVMEWLTNLDLNQVGENSREYFHNLKVLVNDGYTNIRRVYLAASAVRAWQRANEFEQERKRRGTPVFFGEPKQRYYGIKVRYLTCDPKEGYFGMQYQQRFEVVGVPDGEVATLMWFGSNGLEADLGDEIKIDFTVKEHSERYNNTQVLRVGLSKKQ